MDNEELIEKYKQFLNEKKASLNETKKDIKNIVEFGKEAVNNLVSSESHLSNEIQAAELLSPDKIKSLSVESLLFFRQHVDKTENNLKGLKLFQEEIGSHKNYLKYTVGTTEALDSTSSVSVWNLGTFLKEIPDHTLQEQLKNIDTQPSLNKDIECLKVELTNLDNLIGEKFLHLVKDWNAISASTDFHQYLLTFRSIIFDELFAKICPKSNLSRSPWYASTSKKQKYCQPKYFMQGVNEDTAIPPSDLIIINSMASSLEQDFKDLSNLGKQGGIERRVQNTFVQTVSHLANALRMRKQHFKNSP